MDNSDQAPKNKKGLRQFFDEKMIKRLVLIAFGVVLFVILSRLGDFGSAISFFFSVLKPFTIGLVVAYLLNMLVSFYEQWVFRKVRRPKRKRRFSILLAVTTALAVIILLLAQIIPQLVLSIATLIENIPGYLNNLDDFAALLVNEFGVSQDLITEIGIAISTWADSFASQIRETAPSLLSSIVGNVGSGIVTGVTGIIAAIFIVANKEKLLTQVKRVVYAFAPEKLADETMRVARLSNGIFSGFFGGKLVISLLIGFICFVFMSIMNLLFYITGMAFLQMPYALLISIFIGLTNIIPYFGPLLGTIPSAIILFMVSPVSALLFIGFIILLQQIDNNYITPKIVGKSIGLPAMWVFAGTIIGGSVGGISGMLLGVPAAAVLYILASDIVEKRLKKRGLAGKFGQDSKTEGHDDSGTQPASLENPDGTG